MRRGKPRPKPKRRMSRDRNKEGPRPKRKYEIKADPRIVTSDARTDEPPMRDDEAAAILAEYHQIPKGDARTQRRFLGNAPRRWFLYFLAKYGPLSQITAKTGLERCTLARHMNRLGIARDARTLSAENRVRADLDAELIARIRQMEQDHRLVYHPTYESGLEPWMVWACLHMPWHSDKWIERGLAVAKKRGIRQLVLLGDVWNFDIVSRFQAKYGGQMPTLMQERRAGQIKLGQIRPSFDRIVAVLANHDLRLAYALGWQLSPGQLFSVMVRAVPGEDPEPLPCAGANLVDLVVSNCDHLFIGRGPDKIALCHPDRRTKVPCNKANAVANANECRVLMGHPHRMAWRYSDGGHMIAEAGCMARGGQVPGESTLPYAHRTLSEQQTSDGFWTVEPSPHGLLMLPFADGLTNWSEYGCK